MKINAKMENKQFEQLAQNPESPSASPTIHHAKNNNFEAEAQKAMQPKGVDPLQAGSEPPQLPIPTPQVCVIFIDSESARIICIMHFRKFKCIHELPPESTAVVDGHVTAQYGGTRIAQWERIEAKRWKGTIHEMERTESKERTRTYSSNIGKLDIEEESGKTNEELKPVAYT